MIKVGMDISQTAFRGGVGIYTHNLAKELSKLSGLEMTYFFSSLRIPYSGDLKDVKKFRIPPTLLEVLFNRTRVIPIEKFVGNVDIFHSSDWTQPPSKAKKVTTYHDVIPLLYPQWSNHKIVEVHKKRLALVEKEIDCVIAVSEATKKDLLSISNIPEEKIKVVYEGVEDIFKPQAQEEITKFKKDYELPEDFVLAVGGIGERKNLLRIIEATKEHNLVILGHMKHDPPRDKMPLLYASAKALVYTTLYEGFGLPVVEAMASGTPVITSNVSSLPEVGGEAAIYCNPENVEQIAGSLKEVVSDVDLRKELVKKGLMQAKKFSWEKCAKETAETYKML